MSVYLQLFIEFFKIGLFAVGGGPATLPFLMDLTEHYDWYTMSDLAKMIAISESTPGPLGLNMSTYAGFQAGSIPGAIVATMSLVLPSIIIITIIAKFLENFNENPIVQGIFYGIRPVVTALIASAVYGIFQMALFPTINGNIIISYKAIILFVIAFGLMKIPKLKKLHPAVWLAAAAVMGILFQF